MKINTRSIFIFHRYFVNFCSHHQCYEPEKIIKCIKDKLLKYTQNI